MAYRENARMSHGGYRKEPRRIPDFWEVARGCGLGFQCDDVRSQEGVETIFVPDSLWSDLPAVYVGAEWEPVSAPQSRNTSRSHPPQDGSPPMMALRWDAGTDFMQDKLPTAVQRASKRNHRKLAFPEPASSSEQMTSELLQWQPNEWADMDGVLSEATPPLVRPAPPPRSSGRHAPSSSSGSSTRRRSPRMMSASKGGDSTLGASSPLFSEPPLDLQLGGPCDTTSSRSSSICTPRREFTRVPSKCPPDAEVLDDPSLMALESEAHNVAPVSLLSYYQSVLAASMQGVTNESPPRPPPQATSSAISTPLPHERREDRDTEHLEPGTTQAVSKAEASGGRLRSANANDSESTVCSEAGGDNRGDEGVSVISGSSCDTPSSRGGVMNAAPPRPPACVSRCLLVNPVMNRTAQQPPLICPEDDSSHKVGSDEVLCTRQLSRPEAPFAT